jgi:hypothetical protein
VAGMALDVGDPVARILFLPAAVEVLGGQPELDDQDAREVDRRRFSSFFLPGSMEGLLVLAHDDPGILAADEMATVAYDSRVNVNLGHSSAVHRIGAVGHLNCFMFLMR